jgi:hypothetical protein
MRSPSKNTYLALAAVMAVPTMDTASAAPVPKPVTMTFQNGLDDYYGTVDRRIGYQPNDGLALAKLAIDGGGDATDDAESSTVLMRFEGIEDLIPAGAKIIKAEIIVTQGTSANDHSSDAFSIYRLSREFTSDSDIGEGKDFGPDGLAGDVDMIVGSFSPPNIASTASKVAGDITRAVQSWVDGSPNHGVGIRCDRGTNAWAFGSTGGSQANRPKLEVTYILGDDIQATSYQRGLNGYEDSFDIYPNQSNGAKPPVYITKTGAENPLVFLDSIDPPKADPDNPGMIKFGGVEQAMAGRRVESAKLRIVTGFQHTTADSPGPFTVHRMLVPFSETSVYADFAGDAGAMLAAGQISPAITSFTSIADAEVVDVDVSEAVKAWAAGEPNHGLYIGAGTNNGWQIYTTGADQVPISGGIVPGVSFRPELHIVSTPPLPVNLTFPETNTRHDLGAPITFQATATPKAPATITKVEFLIDGSVVGTDSQAPFSFDYPADKLGNYVLTARLTDSANDVSESEPVAFSVVPVTGMGGLYFDGISDHVALGDPAELKLGTFTVETWFKRETKGVATSTGTGGVTAVPLVAKGRNQAENSTLDTNWFLGIRESDGILMGDFESIAVPTANPAIAAGANIPITGVTAIPYGQWNHAAMTFDGTFFRLYLNGNLEREINAKGAVPRADSIQHASIATAMNSTGLGDGAFGGFMDEVRIWNVARTPEEIRLKLNSEVTTDNGLVARWGMTEGSGTSITSSAEPALIGAFGGAPIWSSGGLFNDNALPTVRFTAPANARTYQAGQQVDIEVAANDPESSIAKVEYYDNGVLSYTATTAPFSYPYTVLSGNRRFTAVITDTLGGSTKTDVGLLITGNVAPPTVQGLSAGIIDGGDQELALEIPPVVPAPWAVVTSTTAPFGFANPGTLSGETDVQINGSKVAMNSGVLLTTNVVLDGNTSALDNHAAPYGENGNYRVVNWDNNGPGELQPVTTRESSSFSMGFFPYSKGWIGTTINSDGTVAEGAGALPAGVSVTNTANGSYRISGLPVNGNVIVVSAGKNSDDVASVRRSGSDFWEVLTRDNNGLAENSSFTFLFIPQQTGGVLSGQFQEDAKIGGLNREAAMVGVHTRQTVQGYEITFGDGSLINPSNTALFITADGAEGAGADNIYSYFANGNSFTVFSHDLPGLNGVFQTGGFRFLAVPVNPRVPGNDEVAVSVTKAFATEGAAGDNTLIFTVGRSGSTEAALPVNYTLGGTATAGSDFTAPSGVVTIAAGQTSARVTINVLEDPLLETDETVEMTLTAGGGYSLSPYTSTFGTIRNAASNVESTTVTFQEGLGGYTGTFQRRISRNPLNTTTVDNAINGGAPQQNYGMDGGIPDINDMIRFDNIIGNSPGQIPPGARVLKAELSMLTVVAADAQSGGPFAVGRLTEPVDYETTYSMVHGGAGDTVSGIRGIVDRDNLSAGFGAAVQGAWNTADVTGLVRGWVENGTEDAWNYCTFGNNNQANRPKLVVTYTMVPTERYDLVADRSALFTSRPDSSTVDGSTLTAQGYIRTAPNDTQEAMIRFPLVFDNELAGAIPLDREIVKAELLIRTGGNNDSWTTGSAAVHQVITPWTTSTNFGINGARIGTHVAASSTVIRGMGRDTYAWTDVTSIVRNWRAGAVNEGFNLKLSNAQNWGFHFPGDLRPEFAPVLRITTDMGGDTPAETPFEEWARLEGHVGITMDDDSDGDGIHALAEYAMGLNPKAHDVLPGVTRSGDGVSVSFPKGTLAAGNDKVTYQILSSTNLVDWDVETAATQSTTAISLARSEGETKKFYRLKVVLAP